VASGREQYLQTLASLSDLTRTQAERVAGLLAKQGEVQSAQVGRVAEDLMRRTQKNREIMTRLIQREVKRQLGVLGMATRDEVARLQQRVRALEQEVERASKPRAASSGTAKPSTRTKAASSGSAGSTTRTRRASSGTAKPSTRSRSTSSGTAKPSTRTRTAGASSRSSATSPRTRRTGSTGESGTRTSPT
jgi:polyhydroxyalkanoate synthesis regulator phasin